MNLKTQHTHMQLKTAIFNTDPNFGYAFEESMI